MLRDVRSSSAALGLAAFITVAASENVLTQNDSWPGVAASDRSASTASPTVTFVSYITVSNSTLLGNASNISVMSQSEMVPITEFSDSCPYCCDPDNPSKTAWHSRFASFYNPFDNTDSYGEWSPEVHSSCSLQWTSFVFQQFKTADWGTFCKQNPMTVDSGHSPDWATAASAASQTWFTYDHDLWVGELDIGFTASSPCCDWRCTLTIGDAQVYQWPVSDNPPTFSTLTNTNGYTFIYPSIYIDFRTINARNGYCQTGTGLDQAATFGFDPDLLSTANSYFWNSALYPTTEIVGWTDYDGIEPVYTQFNASQSITCTNTTTMLYMFPEGQDLAGRNLSMVSTGSGPTTHKSNHLNPENLSELSYTWAWITVFGSPFPVTYNPCTPYLSVPEELLTLNPLWTTCFFFIQAIHDPRSALDPSAGFSPLTSYSPVHPNPAQTESPSAGPSISQPFATKTLAPVTYPTSGPTNDPPSPFPISKVPAVYTLGKTMTVTANSKGVLTIGTQVFPPGAQITYSNTVLSLGPDGQSLVIGGTTTLYVNPSYLVGATTISAGGPAVTTLGRTYSVATGGAVVIDGSTDAATQATQATQAPSPIQKIWVPAYIIDGQTLMAGGLPITSSGTVLSLDPVGETVMVCTAVDISVFLGDDGSVETTSEIDSASGTGVLNGSVESTSEIHSASGTGDEKSSTLTAMGSSASIGKTRNGATSRIEVNIGTWCGAVILGIISTCLHL